MMIDYPQYQKWTHRQDKNLNHLSFFSPFSMVSWFLNILETYFHLLVLEHSLTNSKYFSWTFSVYVWASRQTDGRGELWSKWQTSVDWDMDRSGHTVMGRSWHTGPATTPQPILASLTLTVSDRFGSVSSVHSSGIFTISKTTLGYLFRQWAPGHGFAYYNRV